MSVSGGALVPSFATSCQRVWVPRWNRSQISHADVFKSDHAHAPPEPLWGVLQEDCGSPQGVRSLASSDGLLHH